MTDIERLCDELIAIAENSDPAPWTAKLAQQAADTIAGLTAELENRRMCLNCGRYAPEGHNRVDPLPACVDPDTGMAGCAFDHTPDEAWQHWAGIAHKQREEIATLVRERDEAREAEKRAWNHVQGWKEKHSAQAIEARVAKTDIRDTFIPRAEAAIARADRAEEQLRQAGKVIEPFARDAENWADDVPNEHRSLCTEPGANKPHPGSETAFNVGHLRAARTFLASLAKEPDNE